MSDEAKVEALQKSKLINASPTKEFFIHMLTRDIPLTRAILDLVDNSVDGARRLHQSGQFQDYDSKLDESILSDIDTVCAKACSGSMLIVTLNIHPDRPASEEQKNGYSEQTGKQYNVDDYALHEFRQRLGDAVPNEIKGSDLRAKTIGVITRKILSSKVADALSARNGVLQRDKKMHSRQIIYFLYSDSAPMITIGWIFHEAGDENKYEACAFDELKFVRCEESAYTINAPCLTSKEMRHLNSQLPQGGVVNIPGVPNGDIEKYAELYRYFPAFVEAIYS